jgi:hypothetical protein
MQRKFKSAATRSSLPSGSFASSPWELAAAHEDQECQGQEENACHNKVFLVLNWIVPLLAIAVFDFLQSQSLMRNNLNCRSRSSFLRNQQLSAMMARKHPNFIL